MVKTTGGATSSNGPGDTQCLLHIPHKDVGKDLVKILSGIEGVTEQQKADLRRIARNMDDNNKAIERWARVFYFDCICNCGENTSA